MQEYTVGIEDLMLLAFYAGMIESETYFIHTDPDRAQQAICGTVDAMNILLNKIANEKEKPPP